MARKAISMRKAREILRQKNELGLTNRQIGSSLRMSHVTVGTYVNSAEAAGLKWPLPPEIDDSHLMELLRHASGVPIKTRRPMPDMNVLYRELLRKHMTLQLLWEEYRKTYPNGYRYTQFCEYYNRFAAQLEVSLRQDYKAGERMLVDWVGDSIPIIDPITGQDVPAYLFVAILGASNYTFCRAYLEKKLPFWIEAHILAWEFFGGVATLTIPDNEKTGVTNAGRYEWDLQRTYQEMTEFYGTVVIPARPREARDKAKVENAVLHTERRILAALRDIKFYGVGELNAAVGRELVDLNGKPFQKLEGSRKTLYETIEKPALKPLPVTRYEMATWAKATVNIDYHVQADWHLYSVPYQLVHETVEVRLTTRTVEVLHQGRRVAAHVRSYQRGRYTTDPVHRPKSHQEHLEWTPSRLVDWAGNAIGSHGRELVGQILKNKPHPEQGYRSCLGLIRLVRRYGADRMEKACQRAVLTGAWSYRSVNSILVNGLDRQEIGGAKHETAVILEHQNIRGAQYYQQAEGAQEHVA